MKILFIGLGSIFTEGLHYQDNYLFEIAKENHQVLYIADNRKFINGVITKFELNENNTLLDGVLRKKLFDFKFDFLTNSIRYLPGLYKIIETFDPDIIFHHSIQSISLLTIKKYKENNKHVVTFADNHADFHNSGKNLPAKFLHYLFYRKLNEITYSSIDKIFYISYETKLFIDKFYNLPQSKLEYLPLGGIILSDIEYNSRRNRFREEYHIDSNIYTHTGKLDFGKRTFEIISGFAESNSSNHLFIAGKMTQEVEKQCLSLIESKSNIHYLGWKNDQEILDLLCASDLYIQLGVQSATMQNALCCRCAVALFPHLSHIKLLNESYFKIENANDIEKLLISLESEPQLLIKMKKANYDIAKKELDYRNMIKKLTNYPL